MLLPCRGLNSSPTPIPISPIAHSEPAVLAIERSLGCVFPGDYRKFLQEHDGGALDDGRAVFYSVAKHPAEGEDDRSAEEETLRRANLSQPGDAPLVLIGFEEKAEFGFKRADVAQSRAMREFT